MNILQLICSDNFIAVNKTLIQAVGIEPALLLGELASEAMYWQKQEKTEDGYFFSTVENVEERTTLSAYQQRKALSLLQERGLVDVISKKGIPPKRYIRIDEEAILNIFNDQNLKNLTFESQKTSVSNVKEFAPKNKETKENQKEEKKDYIAKAIESTPFRTSEFTTAVRDFTEMRKKLRKPVTDRALSMLLKEAIKLGNSNEDMIIQILNQSTKNSWLGVYPLKNTNYSAPKGRTTKNEFMEMLENMEEDTNDQEGNSADFGFTAFGIPEHTD